MHFYYICDRKEYFIYNPYIKYLMGIKLKKSMNYKTLIIIYSDNNTWGFFFVIAQIFVNLVNIYAK
jgi:hypothetical protein